MTAVGLATVAATALVAGCSEEEEAAELNAATFAAADFSFTVEGAITPGMNEISLTNGGAQTHHAQLLALDEGKTFDDVMAAMAAMAEGGEALPEWAHFAGGPSAVDPGQSATVTQEFNAGTYVLLCFIPDPADGVAHVEKGMVTSFVVEGEDNGAEAPEADITVSGGDYSFDVPETVEAGETVIEFKNDGAEAHEMALVKLNEGASLEDVLAAQGPPPAAFIGGVQGIEPGARALASVNLDAGNYGLLCFFANAEGAPHFTLGMMTTFKVE